MKNFAIEVQVHFFFELECGEDVAVASKTALKHHPRDKGKIP